MHIEDTIAAISTSIGSGGIGIVRLSGPDALKIADRVFRPLKKKNISNTPSHRIIYGHIIAPSTDEIIDEVLVSVMKAPHTYTRDNMVEINCHGGTVPLRRVLELLLKEGARLAEPGEYTRRAFVNGRIDLAQAEAVLDVIHALTVESQKAAVEQLRGTLSKKIDAVRDELIELTALVETYIDFPEEDIESMSIEDMTKRALAIKHSLTQMIEGSHYGKILREGLRTAIIGRPNVGKSSLLNALLEHDRAIVTEIPGTTRDVIEEYLNIEGLPVKIMDTAGIRDVSDLAEKEGVRRSLTLMEDADLVLLLLDGSEELHETDIELIEKSDTARTILILNKSDLPQKTDPASEAYNQFKPGSIINISAKKETGLDMLRNKIVEVAAGSRTGAGADTVTNIRHIHALERALASLDTYLSEAEKNTSPEFLAVELRDALDAVGEISGITTPDDILNRIFSNFCIGK